MSEENLNSTNDQEEVAHFDFDMQFQRGILCLAFRDSTFMRRSNHLLKPENFDSEVMATLCKIAQNFYDKFHTTMDKLSVRQAFKDALAKKIIRDELKRDIAIEINNIFKEKLPEKEFYEEKLAGWARKQAVTNAVYKTVDLIEKQDYSKIEKLMKDALSVGLNEEGIGENYFGDIENRTERRIIESAGEISVRGITTGCFALDTRLYHKGWGRKELSIIMGGAKFGKSMALCFFAKSASCAGFNTLYVTLEVSEQIIADRLDACISDIEINKLIDNSRTVKERISKIKDKCGLLQIVEFPSGTLTPNILHKLIEDYRARGVNFDLVCLDYADLMRPTHFTRDNPIENSRNVYIDLRAIASEFNLAMLTATQTNREGMKAKVAKMEHVSDDINKVRTADLLISINKNEEDKSKNEVVLYFAASRNQEGDFSLRVKQNLAKAQFINDVVGVE